MRRDSEDERIAQPWPTDGLEWIDRCPFCHSTERTIAHRDVQDWSFFAARGKWTYWRCLQCESLHLNPRPTPTTLGDAYENYYTHERSESSTLLGQLKDRLRNECWSHWLGVDLRPRFYIPRSFVGILAPLKSRLRLRFDVRELIELPPGSLLDVGCGNGYTLSIASRLGWRGVGLELDKAAVAACRARGLTVIEGTYARMEELGADFDCVVCSHVLEHVYDPLDLLRRLSSVIKPGGTLLLSCPNATSIGRQYFGDDWRGLEAPRHLAIPSLRQLEVALLAFGFARLKRPPSPIATAAESSRIRRRGRGITPADRAIASRLAHDLVVVHEHESDFIEFVCIKRGTCAAR